MPADFGKGSTGWICAALDILMSLGIIAGDGVSTVGDMVKGFSPDYSAEPNDEEALVLAESCGALRSMVAGCDNLCSLVIDKQSRVMGYNPDGLNAAVFSGAAGNFVAIRGTGAGEWQDNAVALLGRPQTNAYYQYGKNGRITGAEIVEEYASTQQAQALDYFHKITAELGWQGKNSIIITGHSKGGNKAQFITVKSPLIKECYAFCGQGFSPEALVSFRQELGEEEYEERAGKISVISSYNDFVNVLGERMAQKENLHFLDTREIRSARQYHELAPMVAPDGSLLKERARGDMSVAGEKMWAEARNATYKQAASLAVMTLCSHHFGNGLPINGEYISNKTFYSGGGAAIGIAIRSLAGMLFNSGVETITDADKSRLSSYYETLIKPRDDTGQLSYFGQLVGKAVDKLRSRHVKEDPPREVQTGTEEPWFSADTDMLRQNARRVTLLRARLEGLYKEIEDSAAAISLRGAASILEKFKDEGARLLRCEKHLAETADEFEKTDDNLARLAEFCI